MCTPCSRDQPSIPRCAAAAPPQTPPLYRKPEDREYRDGDRVYSRVEAERIYQERERAAYHRDYHPEHPRHPHERPRPQAYPTGPTPPPMYGEQVRDRAGGGRRFYSSVPRHPSYPNPSSGYHDPRDVYHQQRPAPHGAAYEEQRLAAAAAAGGRGFVQAKRELLPEDHHHHPEKMYGGAAVDRGEPGYPKYVGPGGRIRPGHGHGPPAEDVGRLQRSPALSPQGRNGVRGPPTDPGGALPPPLYKAPPRQGPPPVGVSPSLPPSDGPGGGLTYHHPHQQHGSSNGHHHHQARHLPPGVGGHQYSPVRSPGAHGMREGDGGRAAPSPPPHSLRHDVRPRSGSATAPPPQQQQHHPAEDAPTRPGPSVRGRSSISERFLIAEDHGVDAEGGHEDAGRASRPGGSKLGPDEGADDRKTRSSAPPAAVSVPDADGIEQPFQEVVCDESGMARLYIPETPPIVPRRPPSKGNKRETLGDIAHRIPVSVMRPYFNYPLRTAAEVSEEGREKGRNSSGPRGCVVVVVFAEMRWAGTGKMAAADGG